MRGSRRGHREGALTEAPPAREEAAFASLSIRQPSCGYRYSIDSVLLADFAASFCGELVLDLGTGSGVLLLLLSRMCPSLRQGFGVEIQRQLYECARRNILDNGLGSKLSAVHGDFRERQPGVPSGSFDLVVSNPPYRKVGEGRRNPDPQKETARHEVTCTMPELFRVAGRHLSPTGRFAMVGPARRLGEMLSCAENEGIFPEALRFVHPYPDRPANLVLFAGSRRKAPEFSILPPLVVHAEKGRYRPEVERIYQTINPS